MTRSGFSAFDLSANAPGGMRERDGASPVERAAVTRARLEIASMPASDVVQLAIWPDTLASWARGARITTSVVYNMLARVKPYRRVRELLAHRLDVPVFVLNHLVDAERPLPVALRPPDPDRPPPSPPPPLEPPPTDVSLTLLLPGVRDGSNPIERRAAYRVQQEIAALPASIVVQLALYPETLAAWSRRQSLPAPILYSVLAGAQTNPQMRDALARRLAVSVRDVDRLIDARRAEPLAMRPPLSADQPPPHSPDEAPEGAPPASPSRTAPDAGSSAGASPADPTDQLTLGF